MRPCAALCWVPCAASRCFAPHWCWPWPARWRASLLPPLVLGRVVDRLTARQVVPFALALGYFGLLALSGGLESLRESLLTVFGQKMTHALRSAMCAKLDKLPAEAFVNQESGAAVSRFVGDVDTVEELFTSGIISMFADACRLCGILAVIFAENRGLALILLVVLPLLYLFTRVVQKRMLKAQLQNRAAVARASAHVPETLRCIRTIHTLRRENYMAKAYDEALDDSFAAVEKTNFYDACYSPVILIMNAAVVALVMLLSAAGSPEVRAFFGMSVGHGCGGYCLYLPGVHPAGKHRHGDRDDSIRCGRCAAHQRLFGAGRAHSHR